MRTSMKSVDPVRLSPEARFKFLCHKGIDCFNRCCSNIDIMLTPYDILRLRKRLGISSGEFLNDFTYIHIDEKSSLPLVYLKMKEDAERSCLFVSSEGCTIYGDRPASCRYYPVGQASLRKMHDELDTPVTDEFYFFVREDHCHGFREDREWTIASWRDDQGVDVYDDLNRGWKQILFRKDAPGDKLDERLQKAVYLSCYDVDWLRGFVLGSKFLEKFEIDVKKIERIETDDTALMQFGFDYAKFLLMMEQTLKPKA